MSSWPKVAVVTFILGAMVLLMALLLTPNLLPPPATPGARAIQDLTLFITAMGVGVGIFVFALLIYVVVKFRAGPGRPDLREAKPKTHDERLETWWTVIPAIMLLGFLLPLSVIVLYQVDRPPEMGSQDFTITVVGRQWQWQFLYPDNTSTFDTLYVEQGRFIRLDVTSHDVLHAFYVPAFAIKLDAVPARINTAWLNATTAGTFRGQCAEYCGLAHSAMLLQVVVFPEDPDRDFGPEPSALPEAGTRYDVDLADSGITVRRSGNVVTALAADIRETLLFRVTNTGTRDHDLTFGIPWDETTGVLAPGNSTWLNFTVDWTAGTTYLSTQPGDTAPAFSGTAAIATDPRLIRDIELTDEGVPGRDWAILPGTLRATKGETLYLRLWNNGSQGHNFYFASDVEDGRIDATWGQGEYRWLVVTVPDDDIDVAYWCNVPGHRGSGMEGTMVIGAGSPPDPNPYPDSWLWFVGLAAVVLLLLAAVGIRYHLTHKSFEDPPRT